MVTSVVDWPYGHSGNAQQAGTAGKKWGTVLDLKKTAEKLFTENSC